MTFLLQKQAISGKVVLANHVNDFLKGKEEKEGKGKKEKKYRNFTNILEKINVEIF